jgi:hypothetical protein
MSRAEKIFKGVVAGVTGGLGLLAKRDYDKLQDQKAQMKANLAVDVDRILRGETVEDPTRQKRAEEMMEAYGLRPKPNRTVSNTQATAVATPPLRDGRI